MTLQKILVVVKISKKIVATTLPLDPELYWTHCSEGFWLGRFWSFLVCWNWRQRAINDWHISFCCGVSKHFWTWMFCDGGFMIQDWCCFLCSLKPFLDLKVFSQRLQGMMIPSRWFASMWSFMFLPWPSFPHTLQA